jgi:hypothetical protein
MVIGAGRIIKSLQKARQGCLIAQRKPNGKIQNIGGGKPSNWCQMRHNRRHMALQRTDLDRLRQGCKLERQNRPELKNGIQIILSPSALVLIIMTDGQMQALSGMATR